LASGSGTGKVSGAAARSSTATGAVSPKRWIAVQIRLTAVARSLNLRTGVSPGKLFKISTRRAAGQSAASFASAASVVNRSELGTP
jgi:hypothetical protein